MENQNPKQYRLLISKYSYFNPSHAYGKAGDLVTLVAEHGEVWIVEGSNRQRFPVAVKELADQDGKPLTKEKITPVALPAVQPVKKARNTKTTKGGGPVQSPSLF